MLKKKKTQVTSMRSITKCFISKSHAQTAGENKTWWRNNHHYCKVASVTTPPPSFFPICTPQYKNNNYSLSFSHSFHISLLFPFPFCHSAECCSFLFRTFDFVPLGFPFLIFFNGKMEETLINLHHTFVLNITWAWPRIFSSLWRMVQTDP